ncbi:MAG: transposase [Gammaproteobacteria bacterium]|nr:transposase [Gammaproteobacteria bacterium]
MGGTTGHWWPALSRCVLRKKAPGPDPNLPSGQRPQRRGGHGRGFIAGRLRLQVIPNRKQETLEPFVLANVQQGTEARTDGWTGYDNLHKLGYRHHPDRHGSKACVSACS